MYKRGVAQSIELAKTGEPHDGHVHVASPTRAEVSFAIEPRVLREMSRLDIQIWFVLEFDREMLCLPPEWGEFWVMVDLHVASDVLV